MKCNENEKSDVCVSAKGTFPSTTIPVATSDFMPPRLLCPVCGCDFVHPESLECGSPGRAKGLVRIDSRGLSIDPATEPCGRGVQIALAFACEDGHRFRYILSFHKGQTFAVAAFLPNLADATGPDTIWRD